jgi:hypothetical protein
VTVGGGEVAARDERVGVLAAQQPLEVGHHLLLDCDRSAVRPA